MSDAPKQSASEAGEVAPYAPAKSAEPQVAPTTQVSGSRLLQGLVQMIIERSNAEIDAAAAAEAELRGFDYELAKYDPRINVWVLPAPESDAPAV